MSHKLIEKRAVSNENDFMNGGVKVSTESLNKFENQIMETEKTKFKTEESSNCL